MCNAYSITSTREAARRIMAPLQGELELLPDEPRYRVSPRQMAPIVRLRNGAPAAVMALWHFWPPGANEAPQYSMTNARADKLATGWPWKLVSRSQRCLVLADGFYEPEKPSGSKERVPWSYYRMQDGAPFAMAGLWSEAHNPETGEFVDSFTIVTTEANALIRLHDRMPVIVAPEDYRTWLEPGALPAALLRPFPADRMTGWRVSDEARTPRAENSPRLIERAGQAWRPATWSG